MTSKLKNKLQASRILDQCVYNPSYKLIRTDKLDRKQVRSLDRMVSSEDSGMEILKILEGRQADLIVDPTSFRQLDLYLRRMGIPYQITDKDVYNSIRRDFNFTDRVVKEKDKIGKSKIGRYHTLRLNNYNSHTDVSFIIVSNLNCCINL